MLPSSGNSIRPKTPSNEFSLTFVLCVRASGGDSNIIASENGSEDTLDAAGEGFRQALRRHVPTMATYEGLKHLARYQS